jgi:peptide chain release factor 3
MQFEVFAHRLAHEFNAPVEMGAFSQRSVRLTDQATAEQLRGYSVVQVLERNDGALLALFESPYFLARMEADHPTWMLAPIITT